MISLSKITNAANRYINYFIKIFRLHIYFNIYSFISLILFLFLFFSLSFKTIKPIDPIQSGGPPIQGPASDKSGKATP